MPSGRDARPIVAGFGGREGVPGDGGDRARAGGVSVAELRPPEQPREGGEPAEDVGDPERLEPDVHYRVHPTSGGRIAVVAVGLVVAAPQRLEGRDRDQHVPVRATHADDLRSVVVLVVLDRVECHHQVERVGPERHRGHVALDEVHLAARSAHWSYSSASARRRRGPDTSVRHTWPVPQPAVRTAPPRVDTPPAASRRIQRR